MHLRSWDQAAATLPIPGLQHQLDSCEWQLRHAGHAQPCQFGPVPNQVPGEPKQERKSARASEGNVYAEFHPAHGVLETGDPTRRRGIDIGVGQT